MHKVMETVKLGKQDSGHKLLFWVLAEVHSIKYYQTVISSAGL